MELQDALKTLTELRTRIDQATSDYIRTTPFCSYRVGKTSVEFDIRDLLLAAAVTELDVLLIGKTGSGKTRLANGVMEAIFGPEGYYSKTTLPTMNASEFMDIDFPAIIEGRKTLQEAVSGIPSLMCPGIVLNEVNRAPAVIQSMLIAFLDRELEVQGKRVDMGRPWVDGRYQMRILTINEGEAYQVHNLDPAIRDRMTLEIPVDAFPQTRDDVYSMLSYVASNAKSSERSLDTSDSFESVTRLRHYVETVEVPATVRFFLVYLSGLSYCTRAPRGNKESIALSPEVCSGCHHYAAFYNLCGNILAPSARILLRLQRAAKAFALLRVWRTGDGELKVVAEDVIEAAPFVFYSKLSLNPLWVRTAGDRSKQFYGDRWTAIREILAWVHKERFLNLTDPHSEIGRILLEFARNGALNRSAWEKVYHYLMEKDPWAFNPALVRKFLTTS